MLNSGSCLRVCKRQMKALLGGNQANPLKPRLSSSGEKQAKVCEKSTSRPIKAPRVYFYTIDDHGRLYLEGTKHRNFASCLREPKFLDFFFRRIQPTRSLAANGPDFSLFQDEIWQQYQQQIHSFDRSKLHLLAEPPHSTDNDPTSTFAASTQSSHGSPNSFTSSTSTTISTTNLLDRYPFVSVCGREFNFIKPDTCPIVFHSLTQEGREWKLSYAASLSLSFRPSHLILEHDSGKLFHPLSPDASPSSPSHLRSSFSQWKASLTLDPTSSLLLSSVTSSLASSSLDPDNEPHNRNEPPLMFGMLSSELMMKKLSDCIIPDPMRPDQWTFLWQGCRYLL